VGRAVVTPPLKPEQRAILLAIGNLAEKGSTATSIALEAGVSRPATFQMLRQMEIVMQPPLVQSAVEEDLGEVIWFRTEAGVKAVGAAD